MISIIVPVYNISAVLHYCVDSLIAQQGDADCEIILVDDGSTDGSAEICDEYAETTAVEVVHKTNGGLSSARNAGIDKARGEWLIFVDGDDVLLPGTIKRLAEYCGIAKNNVDYIQYGYQETSDYSSNGLTPVPAKPCTPRILTAAADKFAYLLNTGGEAASMCTKMVRRRIFDTLRFKEGILHEDEQFTTHLLLESKNGAYVSDKPYVYIRRPGSITTHRFNSRRLDIINIMNERISLLRQAGLNDAARDFTRRLINNLHLLYMAAAAVGDSASKRLIRKEYRNALSAHNDLKITEKLTRLGFPMLQSEAMVRKLLNRQLYFD